MFYANILTHGKEVDNIGWMKRKEDIDVDKRQS